jgi:hypothetical protein
MGVRYLKKYAALEGVVSVEDAETLAQWLRTQSRPAVHLARCEHLHAAALQVLLALQPRVMAAPGDPWLAQALAGAGIGAPR